MKTREEQRRELDMQEQYARELLRKLNYPNGSFIESLWTAASYVTGSRSAIRRTAWRILKDVEEERRKL